MRLPDHLPAGEVAGSSGPVVTVFTVGVVVDAFVFGPNARSPRKIELGAPVGVRRCG